jgi:hypothetical protein
LALKFLQGWLERDGVRRQNFALRGRRQRNPEIGFESCRPIPGNPVP